MESYDQRIFQAVARLIHERDPKLDEDEIRRQALVLVNEHVRAADALEIYSQLPAPKKNELEDLKKQAEGLADALEKLSFQSSTVLRLVSDPKQLPDLSCLQLEAKKLGKILREGLKKIPAPRKGRKKSHARDSLIEEATNIFEQVYDVNLNDLPEPPTQQSRNIKHEYYLFVRTYMPDHNLYQRQEQFETLKKAADRYLSSRSIK